MPVSQRIRVVFAECGWATQGAVSCAHWLSWRIGLDPATAREKVRVARALGQLPAIDAALKSGKLSYAKVRALTRVATPRTEAKLLDVALYSTGAQLERLCRGYRTATTSDNALPPPERSVRRRDLPGGMVKLEIVLSPDEADLILRSLDRAREMPKTQAEDISAETSFEDPTPDDPKLSSRADAVVALAESYLAVNTGTGNGGDRFQVMVHLDQDALAPDGILSGTLDDGTRVSAETLRRVACDCGLLAQGGHGESSTVPIGRRSRSIPPSIRRALSLRDRGCAFHGCTHTRFLHGHHIHHWLHGGATTLNNLALLCTHHHHMVHEGGWSLTRTPEGELHFTAPDGRELPAVPAARQAKTPWSGCASGPKSVA